MGRLLIARAAAYGVVSLAIIVVELRLASRVPSHSRRDLAVLTDQLMMFATAVSLGGGLVGTVVLRPAAIQPEWVSLGLGALFGAAGVLLRARAMQTLGGDYTLTPRLDPGQKLVATGPYRLVRHPGYAGILLSVLGLQLIVGSWLSLALTALVVVTVPLRIRIEEDLLVERFGAEYSTYRARTHYRLVPRIY